METKILSAAWIAASSLLGIQPINAQDSILKEVVQYDTVQKALALNVEVLSNNRPLSNATVSIYRNNQFIAALNNTLQPRLTVQLEKNTYYVLEVHKPGYVSKSLLISTVTYKDNNDLTIYEHSVSVSLDRIPTLKNNRRTELIGILYYDPKRDIYIGSPMITDAPDKKAIIAQLENWLGN